MSGNPDPQRQDGLQSPVWLADPAQLLRALHGQPGALGRLAMRLAEEGAITWLRTIVDSGVMAQPDSKKGEPCAKQLYWALLKLIAVHPGPDAEQLLADWGNAIGGMTVADLQDHLGQESDLDVVRTLLSRGAHPNASRSNVFDPDRPSSGLTDALGSGRVDSALLMLEHVAARGQQPMAVAPSLKEPAGLTLFDALCSRKYAPEHQLALCRSLRSTGIPPDWEHAFGDGLLALKRAHAGPLLGRGGNAAITPDEMAMLALARFRTRSDLLEVLCARFGRVGGLLAKAQPSPGSSEGDAWAVIQNMLSAGVDPDDVDVQHPADSAQTCTMLQAAVFENNVALTELLLQSGADPSRRDTGLRKPTPDYPYACRDSFELAALCVAQTGDHTIVAMLDAWRAQKALSSVLRAASRPGTPQ